jgi:hypothetical protein
MNEELGQFREPEVYIASDGTEVHGVILDPKQYAALLSWWVDQTTLREKGRKKRHPVLPGLFSNPHRDEYESEIKKHIKATGKVRGARTAAQRKLAELHGRTEDAIRKRVAKP